VSVIVFLKDGIQVTLAEAASAKVGPFKAGAARVDDALICCSADGDAGRPTDIARFKLADVAGYVVGVTPEIQKR
jgi:hypothetical protein